MLQAAIFDCDGVLVDTEPLSESAWVEVLRPHGVVPAEDDHRAMRGLTSAATYDYYAGRGDLPPMAEVVTAVDEAMRRRLLEGFTVFADAENSVRALAAEGFRLGVASSSSRAELDLKLVSSGLGRYFEASVAGDEVSAGKPDPEIYTTAAARLGAEPRQCLAIEDSHHGADAAHAAGMRVLMLLRDGTVSPRFASTADLDAEMVLTLMGFR